MTANDKIVLVYTTFPTAEAAEAAGTALVDRRLAACVNIIPGMTSIYIWNGVRQRDAETVMLVKTTAAEAEAVVAAVKALHSYDNPAALVLPVEDGSAPFLDWIRDQTREAGGTADS